MALAQVIYCDLVIATGHIKPTGGIGLKNKRFNLEVEIEILEDYDLTFVIQLELNFPGLIGSTKVINLNGSMKLSGTQTPTNTDGIIGADSGNYSLVLFDYSLIFKKGLSISLVVNDLVYKETGSAKDVHCFIVFKSDNGEILARRVLIPFHPFSFVSTKTSTKAVTTRFTSSHGFQTSAVVVFEFPACVSLPSSPATTLCSSLSWLGVESAINPSTICSVTGRKLTMAELNMAYPKSRTQTIRFTINPTTTHTCTANDHVNVAVFARLNGRETEQAILFGFDKEPLDEKTVAQEEAAYDEQDNLSFCIGLKATVLWILLALFI